MAKNSLSIEHYAALGRISMISAYVEVLLKHIIAKLVNREHPAMGLLMARKLSAVPMLEMIPPLLEYWVGDPNTLKEAKDLIASLHRHLKRRNDLVHSAWVADKNDDVVKPFTFMLGEEGLDFKPTPISEITPEKLFELAKKIDEDGVKLVTLFDNLTNTLREHEKNQTEKKESHTKI